MDRISAGSPDNKNRWRDRLVVLSLCAAFASMASLPFFVIGEDPKAGCCGGEMPVTHDSWMHFNQMQAFARGLEAGRLYPRWDDATHGFGAPITSFYPPGIYYVTSAFYFLKRDWRWAWVGFYWLTMTLSALACYGYARRHLSHAASLLATAVYVFAPYHLINQYQRGAMGEFMSFVWIPLVLLFAEKLLYDSKARVLNFIGLAASFGAFLWTHPPTAYQLSLVFGSLLIVHAIVGRRWRGIFTVVCAIGFGSMLAGAYFYPAIAEQHLVHYDDVEKTWPYHASYVFDLDQKIYDRIGNPFFGRLDRIWVFNLAVIALSAIVLVLSKELEKPVENIRSFSLFRFFPAPHRLWIVEGLLASFLMTKFSEPIGRWIPKIEIGVFSWRMLALTSFSMALLAGACADAGWNIFPSALKRTAKTAMPALVLVGTLAVSLCDVGWPMVRAQAFEPNPDHYNFATLPRGAPREVPQMALVEIASGQGLVMIERWTPEFRQLRVELPQTDRLQFRTFNFPGWTAIMDGQMVAIQNGTARNIVIEVPAGLHRISLEFRPTPIRRAGNWITVCSFALLMILGVHASLGRRFRGGTDGSLNPDP